MPHSLEHVIHTQTHTELHQNTNSSWRHFENNIWIASKLWPDIHNTYLVFGYFIIIIIGEHSAKNCRTLNVPGTWTNENGDIYISLTSNEWVKVESQPSQLLAKQSNLNKWIEPQWLERFRWLTGGGQHHHHLCWRWQRQRLTRLFLYSSGDGSGLWKRSTPRALISSLSISRYPPWRYREGFRGADILDTHMNVNDKVKRFYYCRARCWVSVCQVVSCHQGKDPSISIFSAPSSDFGWCNRNHWLHSLRTPCKIGGTCPSASWNTEGLQGLRSSFRGRQLILSAGACVQGLKRSRGEWLAPHTSHSTALQAKIFHKNHIRHCKSQAHAYY